MWIRKCQESFEQLKHLLIVAPILKIIDRTKDYMVCTDAYLEGLGGSLMKDIHVIMYESRKLKDRGKNYII